jgi:hypothetical protein
LEEQKTNNDLRLDNEKLKESVSKVEREKRNLIRKTSYKNLGDMSTLKGKVSNNKEH